MTALRIAGGTVYDPANGIDGDVRDICIDDGRIVADVAADAPRASTRAEWSSCPAAWTCTAHVASGPSTGAAAAARKSTRAIPPARRRSTTERRSPRSGTGGTVPDAHSRPAIATPASATRRCSMPPSRRSSARHAHAELDDTPIVDGGFFVLLGNDEYLLRLIAAGERRAGPRIRRLAARRRRRLRDQDRESRRHRAVEARRRASDGARHSRSARAG